MSLIHTIRLRGPWELTPLSTKFPPSERLPGGEHLGFDARTMTQQLPAAWDAVLPGVRGTVRYTRRFGQPTNLEPHERVWLMIEGAAGSVLIKLNGETVSDNFSEVTDLLRERNLLQIDVTQSDPAQPAGLIGEVRLEIRVGPAVPGKELIP